MGFSNLIFVRVTVLICFLSNFIEGKRFYMTRYGACSDCDFHSKSYQWCTLGAKFHDWDYCSTIPGYSSRNKECRSDHQCDFHGQSYLWCYLKEGSWDYCSHIEDTTTVEHTKTGEVCQNYCDLEKKTYVCRGEDQMNSAECSPGPAKGITAHGARCKSLNGDGKNSCGFHGYSYSWCYTDDESWGYCFNPSREIVRKKRAVCGGFRGNLKVVQETEERLADGSSLVTVIYEQRPDSSRIRSPSKRQRGDAETCITNWHNHVSSGGMNRGSTEQTYGEIRLDRQGEFTRPNYGRFLNWQLQINGRNVPSPSTVAHVNIQQVLQHRSDRDWRRLLSNGLRHSLQTSATVWIVQEQKAGSGGLRGLSPRGPGGK